MADEIWLGQINPSRHLKSLSCLHLAAPTLCCFPIYSSRARKQNISVSALPCFHSACTDAFLVSTRHISRSHPHSASVHWSQHVKGTLKRATAASKIFHFQLRISPKQVGKIKSGEYANLIGLAGLCDLVSALQLEQTPRRESEIAVQIPRSQTWRGSCRKSAKCVSSATV